MRHLAAQLLGQLGKLYSAGLHVFAALADIGDCQVDAGNVPRILFDTSAVCETRSLASRTPPEAAQCCPPRLW